MILFLLGYMGSGKSTYGKLLSNKIKTDFIDLDSYIEKNEDMRISQIFATKGELYFRKVEHKYLKDLLNIQSDVVISLGGGTPCYSNNMELIAQSDNAISIFLDTQLDVLTERLFYQKINRPIIEKINSKDELKTFIAKHVFERRDFYNKAKYILKLTNEDTDSVVDQLKAIYDKVTS